CTISFLVSCSGLFSLAITCAGSFGIAGTISFFVSCSGLVRFNVEGASACACAAALEMTKSDVVANVKQIGPRTEARYAGNRGLRQALFFLIFERTGAHRPGPSLMPLRTSSQLRVRNTTARNSLPARKHPHPMAARSL